MIKIVLDRAIHRFRHERIRLRIGRLSHQFEDITEQWHKAHPHLFPIKQRLPFPKKICQKCPFCGYDNALTVLAHVQDSQGTRLRKRH